MASSDPLIHDEPARMSPLFTGFLLLSVGWLALGALTGFPVEASPDFDPGPSVLSVLD